MNAAFTGYVHGRGRRLTHRWLPEADYVVADCGYLGACEIDLPPALPPTEKHPACPRCFPIEDRGVPP